MMKAVATALLLVLVFGGAEIVSTIAMAATAAADAREPLEAAGLADAIRSEFWSAIDVPIPPIRTAVRSFESYPKRSFIVHVEIFDFLFGPVPRRARVLAPCWGADHGFSAGWVDTAAAEAQLRSDFADALVQCPGDPQ